MNPLTILTLLAAALVLLSIVGDRHASAQGSSPVLVTNPSTSPVPVTGHVTFSGEHGHPLPVSIANTPSVGLTPGASVLVGNPAGSPVLIRDTDSPGRDPYQSFKSMSSTGTCFFDPVPMGKRLVVKFVSARIAATVGIVFTDSALTTNGSSFHGLPAPVLIGTASGSSHFLVSANLEAYAEPGSIPSFGVTSVTLINTNSTCSLSGYLISVP